MTQGFAIAVTELLLPQWSRPIDDRMTRMAFAGSRTWTKSQWSRPVIGRMTRAAAGSLHPAAHCNGASRMTAVDNWSTIHSTLLQWSRPLVPDEETRVRSMTLAGTRNGAGLWSAG